MKQQHLQLPKRTQEEWKHLAEKYFEAETSDEEERLLRLFLATPEAQDPAFDELKAVMGYLAVGKRLHLQQNSRPISRQVWKWRSIAAVFFCCLLSSSLYLLKQKDSNQCIAYINGQRCTDSELVMSHMKLSMNQVSQDTEDFSIESQLGSLFDTAEDEQMDITNDNK